MRHHDELKHVLVTFASFLHWGAFILVDACLEALICIRRILIAKLNVIGIMPQPCSCSIKASYDAMVQMVIKVFIAAGTFDVEDFLAFLCFSTVLFLSWNCIFWILTIEFIKSVLLLLILSKNFRGFILSLLE